MGLGVAAGPRPQPQRRSNVVAGGTTRGRRVGLCAGGTRQPRLSLTPPKSRLAAVLAGTDPPAPRQASHREKDGNRQCDEPGYLSAEHGREGRGVRDRGGVPVLPASLGVTSWQRAG